MTRKIQKYLSFFAIILLLLLVCSCGKRDTEKNELGDLYEAISQYKDMLDAQDSLSEEKSVGEVDYVLVIPAGCGADIFDSAAFLSAELSKFVGREVEVVYDCDFKGKSDRIEILIGDTDRTKSKKFLKGLRADDFGYKYDDGVIVIGAHKESTCAETVHSFMLDVANGKVDMSRPYAIQENIVRSQYSISGIKLNGFELCEYDIVYPDTYKLSEKVLAEGLREDIAEYSGYYLRVISEKECTESTRAICVGQSDLTDDYSDSIGSYVSVNEASHIELVSNDALGIYRAVENFLGMIKESEREGICNLELSGRNQYFYNNDLVSLYLVRNDFNSGSLEDYLSAIRGARKASVAVFDRTGDDVRHNLTSNLQNIYSVGELLICYEDTAEFECISSKSTALDSGARVLTLVMSRSDGVRFGIVCGFCEDGSNAANDENFYNTLVVECQSLGDMPIVIIHELDSALGRRFAEENSYLAPLINADGICYTSLQKPIPI